MPVLVEFPEKESDVEKLTRDVVLGILSILSALTIRELLVETAAYVTPPGTSRKLIFTGFLAALSFMVTIIVVTLWQ